MSGSCWWLCKVTGHVMCTWFINVISSSLCQKRKKNYTNSPEKALLTSVCLIHAVLCYQLLRPRILVSPLLIRIVKVIWINRSCVRPHFGFSFISLAKVKRRRRHGPGVREGPSRRWVPAASGCREPGAGGWLWEGLSIFVYNKNTTLFITRGI